MRQLWVATVAAVALSALGASQVQAGKVEVSGVHLCCGQCVKLANATLGKVAGVADVKCDQKAKTITFTTKDNKDTMEAIKALLDAGYYGKVTNDGKDVAPTTAAIKKGDKADEVTIKGVHVCCGNCQKALTALFKGSKVTFAGDGKQKEIKISGKDLDKAEIVEALKKGGFYGKVE